MKRLVVMLSLAAIVSACGSSPTAPTVTIPIVTVSGLTLMSSSDLMKIGTNETFAVFVSRSDGSTGAVSGAAWSTDNAAVATVDGNALVQPHGAGFVTVIVAYQGRQATKLIRVVPDVQGRWVGTWAKTGCTDQSGANVCDSLSGGGLDMTFTQTRDTVSGQVSIGNAPVTVTGSIDQSGGLAITGQGVISGFTTNIAAWTTTVSGSTMNGHFAFVITSTSFSLGFVTVQANLVSVTKR